MNLFEQIKEAVPVWEAAEAYGLDIRRNKMVCCPFHGDRTPSLKLNDTYYYCFGCGAHGDVVDFIARYFGIRPYEAAQKLSSDFGLRPELDKPPRIKVTPIPYAKTKAFKEDELFCFRLLSQYLHLLEDWKAEHAPTSFGEPMDERYVEACQMIERISYLVEVLTDGSEDARVEKVRELMKDGKMENLQAYLVRRKEMQDENAA